MIILDCGLVEELKWRQPCYTFEGKNIVILQFQNKLDEIPALKTAFEALTPGRQRAYIFHFSQPKQSKTRESRVENCMQQILSGKGLDD